MIHFPYGVSDFKRIREKGMLYLDRTSCIPDLEQASDQLVFLRPRRFGKSLLVSMLANYYDIATREAFDTLFGDLAIGKQPTSERNQYMILQWDFSEVSSIGNLEQITHNLFEHLNLACHEFAYKYREKLQVEIVINPDDGISSFKSLCNSVKSSGYTLYLLIDEYDNFANDVLMHEIGDESRYRDLLQGEGIVKTLFKVVKASATQSKISRVFITGVSPVVLSDMTSGYNVATDVSQYEELNSVCAITQAELSALVAQLAPKNEQDDVLTTLRTFYNGYRFCRDTEEATVYNPTLCFYFLRYYQKRQTAPSKILDSNLTLDAKRIRYIARLPQGEAIIDQLMDDDNPVSLYQLEDQFGIEQLHLLQTEPSFMLSLLYYLGVLTITDINVMGKVQLGVPNLVVQSLYIEQLKHSVLPQSKDRIYTQQLVESFYQTRDLQPLTDYLEQHYLTVLSNRDYIWSNELTLKTAFLTLLYNDTFYMMLSEMPVERRYTDLIMLIRPSMRRFQAYYDFIFEFKAIKLKALDMSSDNVKQANVDSLRQLPAVNQAFVEAKQQLQVYREVVVKQTEEPKRLHCLAVVALGFDRVLWEVL